ncbi:heme-binding protein 2-like [Rhinophrynus dorsalis]
MIPGWYVVVLLSAFCLYGTVVRAEEGASDVDKAPPFCRTNECPKYRVVQQYDSFEQRAYEATNWVTTPLELDFFNIGMVTSFRRLFDYISGKNSQGIKIKMTVPVLIYIPSKDSAANATMSFFVPSALVNPPTPLNPAVYLQSFPPKSFYVKSFSGYAFNYDYEKKAKALAEELVALGKPFDHSYHSNAGYNDPFTFLNRHNEVWYAAL